ncbi:MAG: hypothetical protein ACFE95_04320 [Candidatus Hodarchaeota archaeon]
MSEEKVLERLSEIELILDESKKYLRIVIIIMSGKAGLLLWICFYLSLRS